MATDYYVDADKADDSGDGLGWGTAKKHVLPIIQAWCFGRGRF